MTDDIVKRLRRDLASGLSASIGDTQDAADRIEELQLVLFFISNMNYGNGPDVTMEHQRWAKRALGEKTDD